MSVNTETKSSTEHSRRALGIGFAVGLLVGAGMLVGFWLASSTQQAPFVFPETVLNAVATHGGDSFAMATGPISEEVEGIFTLDYLTGNLQCWVIDARTGREAGYFAYNVVGDLGLDATQKNAHYVMVTGRTGLRSGSGAGSFSDCVVYIADGTTGNIAGYVVPWNRNLAKRGSPQKGTLTPVFKKAARQLTIRQ